MTLDETFEELARMAHINYILERAVEGKKYSKSFKSNYTCSVSHSLNKERNSYYYLSKYSLELIETAVHGMATDLLNTNITLDVQTQEENSFCYGETVLDKIESMSKKVKFPYLFTEMGNKKSWWKTHVVSKTHKLYGKFTEDDVRMINDALHSMGSKLLDLSFDWETPPVPNFSLIDICKP